MAHHWSIVGGAALLALACSGGGAEGGGHGATAGAGGSGASAGAAGSGGESGEGGAPAWACEPGPGYTSAATPQRVSSVTATLVDQDGVPVGGELMQVCGLTVCLVGTTSSNGAIEIKPNAEIDLPVLKFGIGFATPEFGLVLSQETDVFELGRLSTLRLPPFEAGAPLTAGTSPSSGGVTLELGSAAQVDIDTLTYDVDQRGFRAVIAKPGAALSGVDPALGFELVVGTAPVLTKLCPAARLSVTNQPGWAPGAAVEVWLQGVDVTQEWAPYGGWQRVSTARVSDDGQTITTTPAEGIPMLGTFGLKLAAP